MPDRFGSIAAGDWLLLTEGASARRVVIGKKGLVAASSNEENIINRNVEVATASRGRPHFLIGRRKRSEHEDHQNNEGPAR